LKKSYASGGATYERPITKPITGSVKVAADGEDVAFDINFSTGLVTLQTAAAPGTVLTAGFEFDVPVRFDADRIETSVASFNVGEIPNIPVIEVRV